MSLPPIEHNVTGIDFTDHRHLVYAGPPLIDIHAHVTRTRSPGPDSPWELGPARTMMEVAAEFGVRRIYTMCPPEDAAPLRQAFGARLGLIASISKKLDEPDEPAYRLLDNFLEQGAELLKFWSAPRDAIRALVLRHPTRFLFGSDLVTHHDLPTDHYRSRYWCQRMLWESDWEGPSPIHDPDYRQGDGARATPLLRGLRLPAEL